MKPVYPGGPYPTPNQFDPRFYTPYINQVTRPVLPPPPTPGGMGNGFGNMRSRGRGALDWLIPPGFLGHVPGRNLFGRPIGGYGQPAAPTAAPVAPVTDDIYQRLKNPQPVFYGGLGRGFAPRYTMRDKAYLTRGGLGEINPRGIYKARALR